MCIKGTSNVCIQEIEHDHNDESVKNDKEEPRGDIDDEESSDTSCGEEEDDEDGDPMSDVSIINEVDQSPAPRVLAAEVIYRLQDHLATTAYIYTPFCRV
jgi:hypothetical protein